MNKPLTNLENSAKRMQKRAKSYSQLSTKRRTGEKGEDVSPADTFISPLEQAQQIEKGWKLTKCPKSCRNLNIFHNQAKTLLQNCEWMQQQLKRIMICGCSECLERIKNIEEAISICRRIIGNE